MIKINLNYIFLHFKNKKKLKNELKKRFFQKMKVLFCVLCHKFERTPFHKKGKKVSL